MKFLRNKDGKPVIQIVFNCLAAITALFLASGSNWAEKPTGFYVSTFVLLFAIYLKMPTNEGIAEELNKLRTKSPETEDSDTP